MNLAEVRQDLADLLSGANAAVYINPPEVPIVPAIIIVPGEPYIEPVLIGTGRYKITFKLTFAVAMTNNQAALNNIEELIFYAYGVLPIGYIVKETSAPSPVNLGNTDLLTSDITIETIIQAE